VAELSSGAARESTIALSTGLRLHVVEWGAEDGWPLVVLHGGGHDAGCWTEVCRRLLAACGAPLLLMRGQHSRILSPESAAQSASLGSGRVVEIPDAGHNVSLDNPQAVADALHHFFAPLAR
jgi:pimeloyl-ACP methyl ester carboxylesterase